MYGLGNFRRKSVPTVHGKRHRILEFLKRKNQSKSSTFFNTCDYLFFPLRHIDLPVVAAAVEHPGAPHPRRSIRPVGMEVGDALLGPVQPHLVRLVVLVPGPVVLAARPQRQRRRRRSASPLVMMRMLMVVVMMMMVDEGGPRRRLVGRRRRKGWKIAARW